MAQCTYWWAIPLRALLAYVTVVRSVGSRKLDQNGKGTKLDRRGLRAANLGISSGPLASSAPGIFRVAAILKARDRRQKPDGQAFLSLVRVAPRFYALRNIGAG